MNKDKAQAICFCHWYCKAEYYITLNGRSIPFKNHVKYLGVIFHRRVICGLHTETIKAYSYASDLALALKYPPPKKHSLGLQGLKPASPENLLQTPNFRNYNFRKTNFSAQFPFEFKHLLPVSFYHKII